MLPNEAKDEALLLEVLRFTSLTSGSGCRATSLPSEPAVVSTSQHVEQSRAKVPKVSISPQTHGDMCGVVGLVVGIDGL